MEGTITQKSHGITADKRGAKIGQIIKIKIKIKKNGGNIHCTIHETYDPKYGQQYII